MHDFTVNVSYRNRQMETVGVKSYSLSEYCSYTRSNITKIIADVENAIYELNNYKDKSLWDEKTKSSFEHIRHRLLDVANDVNRLPSNLYCDGININAVPINEFIAQKIENVTK